LALAQLSHTLAHGLDDLLLLSGAPVKVAGGQRSPKVTATCASLPLGMASYVPLINTGTTSAG
jgi:hypothetical protein